MLPGPQRQWQGTFPGNYGGNLWQTWNIDLERSPGRVSLADNMNSVSTAMESLGSGKPVYKLFYTNANTTPQWWGIIHGTDIVRNGNSVINGGTWVTDDSTNTFNDPRDGVIHEVANDEQRLFVSRATDVGMLNNGTTWDEDWWSATKSQTALTSLSFHPMARLQRLVSLGDKQSGDPVIHTIDKDDVISFARLTFGAEYTVRNTYTSSNRFWYGLQNDYDGSAKIVEWDGFSLTYNNEYEIPGSYPISGFIVRDIPHFINERGHILKFTGGGFEKVQDFNLSEQRRVFGNAVYGESAIENYGCFVDGDIVYINVAAPMRDESAATTLAGVRRARSGVWIYNTKNENLYHNMGFGERLGSGTYKSFGSGIIARAGTLVKANPNNSSDKILFATASAYVGGAEWNTGATPFLYRQRFANPDAFNRGYFITTYIPAEDAEVAWQNIYIKFKRFVSSSNRIVMKWRVLDPLKQQDNLGTGNEFNSPLQKKGTWVSTTTFTCAVPTGVAVGDEVEVISGDNSGCSFNISALSATPDNSTSITVTIDEAAPVSSTDTAVFRFDNWKTETAISATDIGFKKIPLGSNGRGQFIQIKVELRGYDVEVDEIKPEQVPSTES